MPIVVSFNPPPAPPSELADFRFSGSANRNSGVFYRNKEKIIIIDSLYCKTNVIRNQHKTRVPIFTIAELKIDKNQEGFKTELVPELLDL